MVKLIAGLKGTGKSKQIVKKANESLENAKGSVIFIDDDNRAMHELKHNVRFINLSEFPVETAGEFLGFVSGLISGNYDIEMVFIDGILNTVRMGEAEVVRFFSKLNDLSTAYEVNFIVTLNLEGDLPEPLKQFV